MPFSLIPDRVLDRYSDVTPQLLESCGVKLLLCDLDYTLAPKSVPKPDGALLAWLENCRQSGVTVMILSNNRSSRRVETFCGELGIDYVGHAGKPSVRGYRQAMDRAGIGPERTAMLGDKLLTDVLGARRCGVLALMVEPIQLAGNPGRYLRYAVEEPFRALGRRRTRKE